MPQPSIIFPNFKQELITIVTRICFTATVLFLCFKVMAQAADSSFKPYLQKIPGTNLQIKMAPIKAGLFTPQRTTKENKATALVNIQAFWMGAHEVTYDEFDAYMQDENTSQNSIDAITRPSQPYIDMTLGMGKEGGYPANSMQQYGASMYCRWLYQKTGIFFRLPTEAEWEYACSAGAETIYPFGNDAKDLAKHAWYKSNSNNSYHKVGQLEPNSWGLFDMLGNVAEWTIDETSHFILNKTGDTTTKATTRPDDGIVRGGTFKDEAKDVHSAARLKANPVWNRRDPQIPKSKWWNADAPFVGFRIIRPLQQPTKERAEFFFKTYLSQ